MKKLFLAMAAAASLATAAHAQSPSGPVKIGVLNDQSSSFSAIGGTEVVHAVELAIKNYGGKALGQPIELVSADHQNKPDVALSIARQWMEQDHVDAIADVANSGIALSINTLIGQDGKFGLFVSPLTDAETEAACNGHVVAWAYDAYSTYTSPVKALLAGGAKTFFIFSPDYEAGKVQEATEAAAVKAGGGQVAGTLRAPLGTTDFSSYLLQVQASKADAIIINFSGPELVNAMKQVQEFGVMQGGQKIAVPALHQADTRAIGVDVLQGVRFSAPWFWEKNDDSRKFEADMMKVTGNAPGWIAAGAYSAVTNYLKAVDKAGTKDPATILKTMEGMNLDDFFVSHGTMLPNGRLIHDMYLLQVNTPAEVKSKDDFFKLAATVPAAQAFKPLSDTACKLVSK